MTRLAVGIFGHPADAALAIEALKDSGIYGTARGIGVGLGMLPDTAVTAGPAAHKLAGAALGKEDSAADGWLSV
ncbi:hypothetical protein [Paenibacillus sp. sgz500958]|uniref:hypothetical protein n=1 Tax=Paenibacillus sp. sgz500958 TaxID=3242475 RepID=UPI0036D38F8F